MTGNVTYAEVSRLKRKNVTYGKTSSMRAARTTSRRVQRASANPAARTEPAIPGVIYAESIAMRCSPDERSEIRDRTFNFTGGHW
jgi:hypothetical protein